MNKHRAKNGGNDAYFTNPEYAKHCVDLVSTIYPLRQFRSIIEPSAGNGSFLSALPKRAKGYDIFPLAQNIIESDFFNVVVPSGSLVIGNPPFGFSASLAIRFFNHAAKSASVIAFIVPRSFRKASVKRRLDAKFHLVSEEICPDSTFLLNGAPYDVPCVFQVWKKLKSDRNDNTAAFDNPYVDFTTNSKDADFSIRRVGGRAGVTLDGSAWSPSTTFFVKAKRPDARLVVDLCFPAFANLRDDTAGVRSVSKSEIHAVLSAFHIGRENEN